MASAERAERAGVRWDWLRADRVRAHGHRIHTLPTDPTTPRAPSGRAALFSEPVASRSVLLPVRSRHECTTPPSQTDQRRLAAQRSVTSEHAPSETVLRRSRAIELISGPSLNFRVWVATTGEGSLAACLSSLGVNQEEWIDCTGFDFLVVAEGEAHVKVDYQAVAARWPEAKVRRRSQR